LTDSMTWRRKISVRWFVIILEGSWSNSTLVTFLMSTYLLLSVPSLALCLRYTTPYISLIFERVTLLDSFIKGAGFTYIYLICEHELKFVQNI
jgi:hypothetical protein